MKSPLRYQATKFDCGTTSFVNALMFLFEREEIPPEVVRYVTTVTCDHHYAEHDGPGGTSFFAMAFLCNWLNNYAQRFGMPVRCQILQGDVVTAKPSSAIERCLVEGGAVVAGCSVYYDHYALLTGIDDTHARVFDCYYETWPMSTVDLQVEGVEPVWDQPFTHNRLVERRILDGPTGTPYSFAAHSGREAFLFWRTDR